MSMINQIYRGIYSEYFFEQLERERRTGDKEIHVTTLTSPCEQKALYQMRGVRPPNQTLVDVGDRFMGTVLHRVVENIIKKYVGANVLIEKEYKMPLKNGWTVVAHPDILADVGGRLYDLKFLNPTRFKILRDKVQKNPLGNTLQLNMYSYILKKNGINIERAYDEYIANSKTGNKVRTFDMVEIPVELNEKYVRVLMKHADDLIRKYEKGEKGLGVRDTVAKLKGYFKEEGLDTSILNKEGYERWMCNYCDYRDMCPLYNKKLENEGQEEENKGNEEEMEI